MKARSESYLRVENLLFLSNLGNDKAEKSPVQYILITILYSSKQPRIEVTM